MPKTFNVNNKNFLKMVRSKYILEKILNNLQKNKLLNIIRYNKDIRNELNKDIYDYKKEYLKIEIEILTFSNKKGKFINISKKNESYFHIYFNDSKKEIKSNQIPCLKETKKLKIIIDYNIKSLFQLFKNCKSIKKKILLNLIGMILKT